MKLKPLNLSLDDFLRHSLINIFCVLIIRNHMESYWRSQNNRILRAMQLPIKRRRWKECLKVLDGRVKTLLVTFRKC